MKRRGSFSEEMPTYQYTAVFLPKEYHAETGELLVFDGKTDAVELSKIDRSSRDYFEATTVKVIICVTTGCKVWDISIFWM